MKKYIAVTTTGMQSAILTREEALAWAQQRFTQPSKGNTNNYKIFLCEIQSEVVVEAPPIKVIPFAAEKPAD